MQPLTYFKGFNEGMFKYFTQEQNRLAVYLGGKPKYRKMSRMDKVHRKEQLGIYPEKSKLSSILYKLAAKATFWYKQEAINALKIKNNVKCMCNESESESSDI